VTGSSGGTKLIRTGDVWKFFKGTAEPTDGNRTWNTRTFDDAAWLEGPSGIGYGDGDDNTVLADMQNLYTTVYARKSFTVNDPADLLNLELDIDYDDGFVAYLNGQEVARR